MNRLKRFVCVGALTVASIMVAHSADATQDLWPALFDVAGVEASDVLNIRSGPSASAEIIGSLDPDQTDVEIVRPNDDLTWGLVNVGEQSGWVSLTFVTRQPGQWAGALIDIRQCFGTEPFWSLTYDAPRITLTAPGIAPREGLISGLFRSNSRRDRFAFRGSFLPSDAGNRDVAMSVRLEACNDGMSDRDYGIGVDMLITRPDLSGDDSMTGLYSGCCTLSPPPGG